MIPMTPRFRLLFAAALLLAAPTVLAWSVLGHRLIGELAQRHLTPAARAQVELLLAGEPDPTLAGVSTWADDLRSSDPDAAKRTSSWHYVNFKGDGCTYVPARDCPDGNCVIGAIEAQTRILADRSRPLAERRDALKFVVHFVGDAHQPLHASDRRDKGGNDYQISLRTDLVPEGYAKKNYANGVMGTNLHSIWDYYVLGSAGFGSDKAAITPYADRLDAAWPTTPSSVTTPAAWAEESCRAIDTRQLYPAGESHKMDKAYLDSHRPFAEQRVEQAAVRLAALLNGALK